MMNRKKDPIHPAAPLELWAGIECTVNRVGDRYYDQLVFNGHDVRLNDLNLLAELGVQAVRYPVLWERTSPERPDQLDWRWVDERLPKLRELGIRPIVGLVHHGSGPRYTSLIDASFPEKLADYARAVAEHFPWVDAYIPVNEIVTTARFSGLYGHWYPHGTRGEIFARAVINQARGIQLAMHAIREVNPQAQLIQTDDLGKVYSTPSLAYQADFENERRWLGFDLLCGRVGPSHALYDYLVGLGISAEELEKIQNCCIPPDILGFNYYITSERFLDDRIDHYPPDRIKGNDRDGYADVEAARVCQDAPGGRSVLFQEAWERYALPMAATEVHLAGYREDQLRWWMEAWNELQGLRQGGVDIRAITAWSLFGAFHWDKLLKNENGHYETGYYDVRSSPPRPTLLVAAVQNLAKQGSFDHPILDGVGWWQRPQRILYPPAVCQENDRAQKMRERNPSFVHPRPVLILGARGTLGQAFQGACAFRGIEYQAYSRDQLDISKNVRVEQVLEEIRPWAVINAAGYTRVDDAEQDSQACRKTNTAGATLLAVACAQHGIQFLSFSSALVFDGEKVHPYVESDSPNPLNVYGSSQADAEASILQCLPQALVVRTSAFFSAWDANNFPVQALNALTQYGRFEAAKDTFVSPTYLPDLVDTCLDLLIDGESGIWHLANRGAISWYDFACAIVRNAGLNTAQVIGCSLDEMGFAARRPRYSVLGSERAYLLPDLDDAIGRFSAEWDKMAH